MLTRKTVILAKIESQYGVDPTPTVSENAILIKNVTLAPFGEAVKRDFLKSSLGQFEFVRGISEYELSFETELKGTGTIGELPSVGWEGVLARACGFDETVNTGTSIVHTPVSDSFESCTIYLYKDGLFHKLLGCQGNRVIELPVGQYGIERWTMRALYAGPTDASPAAQTFSTVIPPRILSASFTFDTYAAILTKLTIDMRTTIGKRLDMNEATGLKGQMITGRSPGGSIDPEAVTEATKDFWAMWGSAEAVALSVGPLGSVSGNRIAISCPKSQIGEMRYGDREGIMTYEMPLEFAETNGDDEITITYT